MNIERSPVIDDGVLVLRDRNDSYFWMLAEQLVTNGRSYAGLVERDNNEIWVGSLYNFRNLRLLADFANDFDVGLIRKRCEY